MPRAFDITASTSTVQLDASGQGEVSFTVSNALGQRVRVRAVVEPSGGAKPEWMSLPEGQEKELAPDGTAVFVVRLSVPKGTPPGTYGLGLVVASVSNPDEHYARGPGVAFTVPRAEPEEKKKGFPWVWVALIGGVVVIVGGVVAILAMRDEPASLGEECTAEVGCVEPLVCHEGLCLVPEGRRCTSDSQCVSSNCEDNECRPPERTCPGGCPVGHVCLNGRCVKRRPIQVDPKLMEQLQRFEGTPSGPSR